MSRNERCFLLLIICVLLRDYQVNSDRDTRLSRKKRYVVFPEGSTFSIALCLTVHTLTPDDNIFTEGVNWGISYDLPNESKPALEPLLQLRHDEIKPLKKYGHHSTVNAINKNVVKYSGWHRNDKYYVKPGKSKYHKSDYYYLQRRHRRQLYNKLETIMNAMNFEGRTCVFRALCEASQRLMPKGNTLIEEMMRISFSFPLKRLFAHEPEEHHAYSRAHKAGHEGHDCASMYAGCSFSLIDMALGKYDTSATRRPQLPPGYADTVESFGDWARYNMK
ncbi:uncharacterized protein LOC117161732 [Bombus vancouverensis nearcticus]|uniref:Uncharacterized protein LOC117212085 n=1 Tax=Bombus bifarius TaxID=103933 RepID=A0A6P8MUM6_9HYME|nr:uncharacterized protein LOC117161732 [Bombus vancouverensis nearcticus]XP_033312454.1 uncharacterized protein LOC117212085 [Bombus bifarius]